MDVDVGSMNIQLRRAALVPFFPVKAPVAHNESKVISLSASIRATDTTVWTNVFSSGYQILKVCPLGSQHRFYWSHHFIIRRLLWNSFYMQCRSILPFCFWCLSVSTSVSLVVSLALNRTTSVWAWKTGAKFVLNHPGICFYGARKDTLVKKKKLKWVSCERKRQFGAQQIILYVVCIVWDKKIQETFVLFLTELSASVFISFQKMLNNQFACSFQLITDNLTLFHENEIT